MTFPNPAPHPGTSPARRARIAALAAAGVVVALMPATGLAAGAGASTPTTASASAGPAAVAPVAVAPGATGPMTGATAAVAGARSAAVAAVAQRPTEATAERRTGRKKRFWKQVAVENFNRLDRSRWGVFSGRPGCCPDAEWDASMVKVNQGKLLLQTGPRNGRWLSGGVGGWNWKQGTRRYGRWDARIRFDRGRGVSAAALLWPTTNAWPPELDFYEIYETWGGRQQMATTTHWRKANGERDMSRSVHRRDFSRWHVASVRWMPSRVVYYLDGKQVKVDRGAARVPRMKMWVGFQTHAHRMQGRYAAPPSGKSQVSLAVDWVRVYRLNR